MAGAFVKIDINENGSQVAAALERFARQARDLGPVFDDIGEYLLLSHDRRFDEQQSPDGDAWTPLSQEYKARKKRNRDKILVLDDLLGGTLRYQTTAASLVFGTDRIYGATHQFGDDERGIPARPYLGLSGGDEAHVANLIGEHLLAAMS